MSGDSRVSHQAHVGGDAELIGQTIVAGDAEVVAGRYDGKAMTGSVELGLAEPNIATAFALVNG